MTSKQDILSRYTKSKSKDSKKKKSNLIVFDEVDDWGQKSDSEPIVEPVKRAVGSWTIVAGSDDRKRNRSQSPNSKSISPARVGRASPSRRSPTPERSGRQTRRSPTPEQSPRQSRKRSPSPVRDRHSRNSPVRDRRHSPSPDRETHKRMSDGTLAGLQTGSQLRSQLKSYRDEIHSTESKKETVYRDKQGRKIDIQAERQELEEQKQMKLKLQQEQLKWTSGIAQQKEREQLNKKFESDSQFAISKDDKIYNDELKEKIRWGDTMAPLVKKKKQKQMDYKGPTAPPNRFGIKPGYRWDGIDRSNGWEVKVFQAKRQYQEKQRDYHKWATEDM